MQQEQDGPQRCALIRPVARPRFEIAGQVSAGESRIMGVMIESNLVAGRQDVVPGITLTYGQSITDGCIDWTTTVSTLNALADAVASRRALKPQLFREYSA